MRVLNTEQRSFVDRECEMRFSDGRGCSQSSLEYPTAVKVFRCDIGVQLFFGVSQRKGSSPCRFIVLNLSPQHIIELRKGGASHVYLESSIVVEVEVAIAAPGCVYRD